MYLEMYRRIVNTQVQNVNFSKIKNWFFVHMITKSIHG